MRENDGEVDIIKIHCKHIRNVLTMKPRVQLIYANINVKNNNIQTLTIQKSALCIYRNKFSSHIHIKTCPLIFITTLFTIDKPW
jgi:hypothetical protein